MIFSLLPIPLLNIFFKAKTPKSKQQPTIELLVLKHNKEINPNNQ